ncbi:Uncharacterised protein [Clostridium tertium]|uniref:Uncharacterized protein n=2 Tax=Clostridium tertium TaxID=1559 RepID=A0A6N3GLG7_9CLOT
MNYERSDDNMNVQNLMDECKNLMGFHIIVVMKDGSSVDGIIDNVDSNGINMLAGEDMISDEDEYMQSMHRQFGNPKMRRHRRFRRKGFPFHGIRRVFPIVFPFFPFYPF